MSEPDPDPPEADCLEGARHPRHSVHLYGHDRAEAEFLAALKAGRLHHAWALSGPRGIGKATLAWRMARTIIRADGGPAESLQIDPDDPVFTRIAALGEPRLFLLRRAISERTGKLSNIIAVEDVRRLKSFFNLTAADGGWRVAIVDAADEMNVAAANALLKVLEEPPPRVLLLLVVHQPGSILPTIRSRTRDLPLHPLDTDAFQRAMADQGLDGGTEGLHALAEGSVGRAVTLLQSEGLALYGDILDVLADARKMDRAKIAAIAARASDRKAPVPLPRIMELIETALARLAKAGALASPLPGALPQEAALHASLAASPKSARMWAETAQTLRARALKAHAVNLDASHVILDTFLAIEAAAQTA